MDEIEPNNVEKILIRLMTGYRGYLTGPVPYDLLFGDEDPYDVLLHKASHSIQELINSEVLSALEELESNITLNIKATSVHGTTKVPSKLVIKSPISTMEALQSIKNRYKL